MCVGGVASGGRVFALVSAAPSGQVSLPRSFSARGRATCPEGCARHGPTSAIFFLSLCPWGDRPEPRNLKRFSTPFAGLRRSLWCDGYARYLVDRTGRVNGPWVFDALREQCWSDQANHMIGIPVLRRLTRGPGGRLTCNTRKNRRGVCPPVVRPTCLQARPGESSGALPRFSGA